MEEEVMGGGTEEARAGAGAAVGRGVETGGGEREAEVEGREEGGVGVVMEVAREEGVKAVEKAMVAVAMAVAATEEVQEAAMEEAATVGGKVGVVQAAVTVVA
jgi:hypothetical protein